MSIWFELLALSLAAYAVGLLLGWVLWGNTAQLSADDAAHSEDKTPNPETSNPEKRPTT